MSTNNDPDPANPGSFRARADAEQVLETIPDLIFEFSPDGVYTAMHTGRQSDLYCPPDQFLGRHFSEVLPTAVADQFDEAFDHVRERGEGTDISYMLPGDDQLSYFECRLFPLDGGNILAVIRNITESWRDKTELEQSESRYRTLVNNLPGLVYRCHIDENWTAVFISPGIADMLGYPADDVVAGKYTLEEMIHPEDREMVRRQVMDAIEQDRPFHVSYRMLDADGQIRRVTERGQAIYAEFDEVTYLNGVILDVTDIHRMRQRMMINSKMAAVGNLAAGVAHEINNPLAIALANVEYTTEELATIGDAVGDDPPVVDALSDVELAVGKIQEGIARVREIIDDLRAFTDAAAGRADRLDVRRVIEWTVRRANSRTIAPEHIETHLQDVAPIWASEVGVVQVLWNLMDNALEAIERLPDGDGVVEIRLSERDDRVCLDVIDDGPGMEPDVAERAYEPFFTTKPVGQGAGLGLFVCQGLVESMDGTIDLNTAAGEGTRVRVCFPAFSPPGYGSSANDATTD